MSHLLDVVRPLVIGAATVGAIGAMIWFSSSALELVAMR